MGNFEIICQVVWLSDSEWRVQLTIENLYKSHIERLIAQYVNIISAHQLDSIVLHSGTQSNYQFDDRHVPFQANPHFLHFVPVNGPDHLLQIVPGGRPKLILFSPEDFWYETGKIAPSYWQEHFDLIQVADKSQLWKNVDLSGTVCFLGDTSISWPEGIKSKINLPEVLAELNWLRAIKSKYEIEMLNISGRKAVAGHVAARDLFLNEDSISEYDLYMTYLKNANTTQLELPYDGIVGLDEKSAVLHYENRRRDRLRARVFLIDSGYRHQGYSSDITRTYAKESAHPTFRRLLRELDQIQQNLCSEAKVETEFVELHKSYHKSLAELLINAELLQKVDVEEAMAKGLTTTFCPHGLGHMLGIQTHDVGGDQKDAIGTPGDADPLFPKLRTVRALRENEVVTIEPGIYFIPSLLNKQEASELKEYFNWPLIQLMKPLGGMRIEDNVVVEPNGSFNLTRSVEAGF